MRRWTAAQHPDLGDGVRCGTGGEVEAYAGVDGSAAATDTDDPLQHPTLTDVEHIDVEQQRGEQQHSGRVLSRESAAGELAHHDDACDDEAERAAAAR